MSAIIKKVDDQGRVVIPKKWRDQHLKNTNSVVLDLKDGEIVIKEYELVNITKHFNSLDVDIKSDLTNWDDVKGELLQKKPQKSPKKR